MQEQKLDRLESSILSFLQNNGISLSKKDFRKGWQAITVTLPLKDDAFVLEKKVSLAAVVGHLGFFVEKDLSHGLFAMFVEAEKQKVIEQSTQWFQYYTDRPRHEVEEEIRDLVEKYKIIPEISYILKAAD